MTAPRPLLAVLDYGMGNLRSVSKALEHVDARAEVTSEHRRIAEADGLVLPGVGAFPAAMAEVRARGLDGALSERLAAGVPVLGICLGMQLLFERSEEMGGAEGLGLLRGEVRALAAPGLKVPQIGWNEVGWRRDSPLIEGLPRPCAFYHVHSFAPHPADAADVLGAATYGERFCSVVERDRLFGVQFHPEKSGDDGLRLLANFARMCAGDRAAERDSGRAASGAAAA